MSLHKCFRCHKEFKTSQHYMRHLRRKFPCKVCDNNQKIDSEKVTKKKLKCNENVTNERIDKSKKITIYQCDACKKTFKHRQNKYAHMKTCKKVLEKDKNQKIKELNQKIQEMKLKKNIIIVNKLDHH